MNREQARAQIGSSVLYTPPSGLQAPELGTLKGLSNNVTLAFVAFELCQMTRAIRLIDLSPYDRGAPVDTRPTPMCVDCGRSPSQIKGYDSASTNIELSPDDYVRIEEPTFNRWNGHFLCEECNERTANRWNGHFLCAECNEMNDRTDNFGSQWIAP